MKVKLTRFSDFAQSLLPLEASFLEGRRRFEDAEKIHILDQLVAVAKGESNTDCFDPTVDKRKYSYVKNWCEDLLQSLDVDENLEKLMEWEHLILTDRISLADEKALIKRILKTEPSDFNFIKIYETGRSYRHYLQIRLRYKDYQLVHQFLTKYRTDYEFSRLVNDKLHEATNEIISDYSHKQNANYADSFPWLRSLFYNENLDGYNRLLAWIRMVFIAHNKRAYDMLGGMFDYFEQLVKEGKLYSRRIVTNFYSQYLLYYASIQDFQRAAACGYLSIKEVNNDYLYYINNLAAVLLRTGRANEALSILKTSAPMAKNALNQHNKIGHAAYTIFALIDTDRAKQAENHAFVFITAFKKEIFEHRWHLFFTAYFKAMLVNANYRGVIKAWSIYKLGDRDSQYTHSPNYAPSLPWMYYLAMYKKEELDLNALQIQLKALAHQETTFYHAMNRTDLWELSRSILKHDFAKLGFTENIPTNSKQ